MSHAPDAAETAARSAALGRNLSAEEARLLAVYLDMLVRWNRRMNLVGPASGLEILETLIQDSWFLADLLTELAPQPGEILDLGAGAGLPGIPLRVFWKSGRYFLVEPPHLPYWYRMCAAGYGALLPQAKLPHDFCCTSLPVCET